MEAMSDISATSNSAVKPTSVWWCYSDLGGGLLCPVAGQSYARHTEQRTRAKPGYGVRRKLGNWFAPPESTATRREMFSCNGFPTRSMPARPAAGFERNLVLLLRADSAAGLAGRLSGVLVDVIELHRK